MFEVDIYISVMGSIRPSIGYWSYALEAKGSTKTREGFGEETMATRNILNLMALFRALERMTKPSRITVHTDSAYLAGNINDDRLELWAHNDWKNARGQPVKNAEIWKEIWQQSMEHELTVELAESHSYKSWQKSEMKRMAKEAKNVDFTKNEGTYPQF